MTVKELIADLQKIPGDYEVQVFLSELPLPDADEEEMEECFENVEAVSAYLFSANANHEEKLAYVFGAALPDLDAEEPPTFSVLTNN